MSEININQNLNRENIANEIIHILSQFETKYKDVNFKKGIYIYGSPGCGKPPFAMDLLRHMDYYIFIHFNRSIVDLSYIM